MSLFNSHSCFWICMASSRFLSKLLNLKLSRTWINYYICSTLNSIIYSTWNVLSNCVGNRKISLCNSQFSYSFNRSTDVKAVKYTEQTHHQLQNADSPETNTDFATFILMTGIKNIVANLWHHWSVVAIEQKCCVYLNNCPDRLNNLKRVLYVFYIHKYLPSCIPCIISENNLLTIINSIR